jgi:hypothetical protein
LISASFFSIKLTAHNLLQADAGSSGNASGGRRFNAPQPGAEQFQMKIANNKVYCLFLLDKKTRLIHHMEVMF